MFIDNF
jgi:hypothetical protein